ncbi:MAG: hypothetical protein ACK6DY_20895 [Acidobacteriota bacterium]|jgi:hypothetical protein|nr:hypothetical protein [Bryobacteraceae bacterium CoA2 C42]
MRILVWLIGTGLALAAAPGGRVEYIGGTVESLTMKTDGRMNTADGEKLVVQFRNKDLTVPFERINQLEYGQKVDRRYLSAVLISPIFLLAKSRKHFLTVGYQDAAGRQQAMIFRVAKGDIRALLVTLEARTGRKVIFQDEEARKAGKG